MKLTGRSGSGAHTLVGAYAMDALSSRDRAGFERHLAGCEDCAQEVASLREATARLATATAVAPPSGLKERVLAAAAITRQQAPAESDAGSRAASRTRAARLSQVFGRVRWPAMVSALAAVVVLGVAVAFGVANGSMRQQLDQAQSNSQQIAAVLTAKDAVLRTKPVFGGGTATIVMSHSRHALVFTAAGLRALPPSRAYELWLIGPDSDRPVGMLPAGRHGTTGPLIASGLREGDQLVLTAEPAGGSRRPDMPMMLDVVL
ncbi:MAG TPA: anti-sigma factor [Streptosporangiaceae bacterium]|nr:anti-sigma factor [Streptosporangiaceae bacterium]